MICLRSRWDWSSGGAYNFYQLHFVCVGRRAYHGRNLICARCPLPPSRSIVTDSIAGPAAIHIFFPVVLPLPRVTGVGTVDRIALFEATAGPVPPMFTLSILPCIVNLSQVPQPKTQGLQHRTPTDRTVGHLRTSLLVGRQLRGRSYRLPRHRRCRKVSRRRRWQRMMSRLRRRQQHPQQQLSSNPFDIAHNEYHSRYGLQPQPAALIPPTSCLLSLLLSQF